MQQRSRNATPRCATMVAQAIAFMALLFHNSSANATGVLVEPTQVNDPDGAEYLPRSVALLDSSHVLAVYRRGVRQPNGSLGDQSDQVRVYNIGTGTFSQPYSLHTGVSNWSSPVDVAVVGQHRRIVFHNPTGLVLDGCEEACSDDLRLASLDAQGNIVTSVNVNANDSSIGSSSVAILSDGTTLVVWFENAPTSRRFRILGRLFDSSLNPLGSEFHISAGHTPAMAPDAAASSNMDRFAVGWSMVETAENRVAELDDTGDVMWVSSINQSPVSEQPPHPPSVALINSQVYVGTTQYDDELNPFFGDSSRFDVVIRGFDEDGVQLETSPFVVNTIRAGKQSSITLVSDGFRLYSSWPSDALDGMLDFAKLDRELVPLDADPPLIDNAKLGYREFEDVQPLMASDSSTTVVLYAGKGIDPEDPNYVGVSAKMTLLEAGDPECPSDVSCGFMVPFHMTGPASRRLNVALLPAGYKFQTEGEMETPARAKFIRELRDILISEIYYGARQYRAHFDRFNFFAVTTIDATDFISHENPAFGACSSTLEAIQDSFPDFTQDFPWVTAVGSQENRDDYTTTSIWCANFDSLPSGGGDFIYPGAGVIRVFPHEMAHAIFRVRDEAAGSAYQEDIAPIMPNPQEFLLESDCRNYASQHGWDPDDCHLMCDPVISECAQSEIWWSPELRQPKEFFDDGGQCQQFQVDHALDVDVFPCRNLPNGTGETWIPALNDLMERSAGEGDAASETYIFDEYDSFQLACEIRVLTVLEDPGLYP